MNYKEILHYYILAFMLLIGYYIGDFFGITTFAFQQNQVVLMLILTLFYGTYILIIDNILHKILELK